MILILNFKTKMLNMYYNENMAGHQPDGLYSLENYLKHFELEW
jgi:hypothetical protein